MAENTVPLETSLVEWKHMYFKVFKSHPDALGNFLSGMETKELLEQFYLPS